MRTAWTRLAAQIESIARAMGAIGSFCAFVIFLTIVIDVTGREIIGVSTKYALDINELLMLPLVFLVLPYVAQIGANVRLDIFTSRLGPRGQRVTEVFAQAVFLVFAALIAWGGWNATYDAYRLQSVTQVGELPIWPAFLTILLGGVVLCLQTLILIIRAAATPAQDTSAFSPRAS